MVKYVKIVKCSKSTWWYNHSIGKIFKVANFTINQGEDYKVLDSSQEVFGNGLTVIDCIDSTEQEYCLQESILYTPLYNLPENHDCLIHLIKKLDNGD